jgi:hypothetical protein
MSSICPVYQRSRKGSPTDLRRRHRTDSRAVGECHRQGAGSRDRKQKKSVSDSAPFRRLQSLHATQVGRPVISAARSALCDRPLACTCSLSSPAQSKNFLTTTGQASRRAPTPWLSCHQSSGAWTTRDEVVQPQVNARYQCAPRTVRQFRAKYRRSPRALYAKPIRADVIGTGAASGVTSNSRIKIL